MRWRGGTTPKRLFGYSETDHLCSIVALSRHSPDQSRRGVSIVWGILSVVFTAAPAPGQLVLYVDADAPGLNDGSSWEDAYNGLQRALDHAGDIVERPIEIRIAQGTYRPSRRTEFGNPRSVTFQLLSGLTLRGGHAGWGAGNPDERDIARYETILSGDLDANDGLRFADNDENAYHVVTTRSSGTVLDGLTITGGNAHSQSSIHDRGAGILNVEGGVRLVDCTIVMNTASWGGGIFNTGYVTAIGCRFEQNRAYAPGGFLFVGGGIFNWGTVSLDGCLFIRNAAQHKGGAIYDDGRRLTLTNCMLIANWARWAAGLFSTGDATLTNCTIVGNMADSQVGGVSAGRGILTNCILWDNTDQENEDESAQIGSDAPPIVNYSCVQGLTGALGGAGNIGDDPLFVNLVGVDGIPWTGDENLRLSKRSPCVDAGTNSAPNLPASDFEGDARIQHCRADMGMDESPFFVDANGNGSGDTCDASTVYVDDSRPPGGHGRSWVAAFNDLQDALDYAIVATDFVKRIRVAQGTYRPSQRTEPADRRSATFRLLRNVPLYGGFAGHGIRPPGSRSITQYETVLSGDLNENDEDFLENRGDNAYHVVTAIGEDSSFLLDGFTIKGGNADQPRHYEGGGIRIEGGSLSVANCRIEDNRAWYGGALFSEWASLNATRCLFSRNHAEESGGGLHHVGWGTETSMVRNCEFNGNFAGQGGGLINGSRVTIMDCVFASNRASRVGGALSNTGEIIVVRVSMARNSADEGGAIYNSGNFYLTDSSVQDNDAHFGGALVSRYGSTTLSRCRFGRNRAYVDGGGLWMPDGSVEAGNCVFYGNTANGFGGAISKSGGSLDLRQCTVFANRAYGTAGGVIAGADTTLLNCILWGNVDGPHLEFADELAQITGIRPGAIHYSSIQGWTGLLGGVGNVGDDPMFVDPEDPDGPRGPAEPDLRLSADSPLINAGDPDFVADAGEGDLDGHARVLCGRVDLGAYEFGIGDFNCDRVAGLDDFAAWADCMIGPFSDGLPDGCEAFDFNADFDVDLHDYAGFQTAGLTRP